MLSVRAGHTRRQAPFEPGRPLKFPLEVATGSEIQVDILAILGRAKLTLTPGTDRYVLQLESTCEKRKMSCEVEVRNNNINSIRDDTLATPPKPIGTRPSNGATDRKRPPSTTTGRTSSSRRHDNAISVQRYMERHRLVEAMQSALKATVSDRPEDPFTYMANRLLMVGTDLKPPDEAFYKKSGWEVDTMPPEVDTTMEETVISADVSATTSTEAAIETPLMAQEPQQGSQADAQAPAEVPPFPTTPPSASVDTSPVAERTAEAMEPPPGRGAAPGGNRFQLPPLQMRPAASASEQSTDSKPLAVNTGTDTASGVSEQSQIFVALPGAETAESSSKVSSPPVQMPAPTLFPCKLPPPRSICSTIEGMSEAQAGSIDGELEEEKAAEEAADETLSNFLGHAARRERHARAAELRQTPPSSPTSANHMPVGGILSTLVEAEAAEPDANVKEQLRNAFDKELADDDIEDGVLFVEDKEAKAEEERPPLQPPGRAPSKPASDHPMPATEPMSSGDAQVTEAEPNQEVLGPPESKHSVESVATTDQLFIEDEDDVLTRPALKAVCTQSLEQIFYDAKRRCSGSPTASLAPSVTWGYTSAAASEAGRAASAVYSAAASAVAGEDAPGATSLQALAAIANQGSATALELEELTCIRQQIRSKFAGWEASGQLDQLITGLMQDPVQGPDKAAADTCWPEVQKPGAEDMNKIRADIKAGLEQHATCGDLESIIRETLNVPVH